jgi:hypothetical protein
MNPLYRECCRDLAKGCRAIAAPCTPSTEMRTRYSWTAERYGSLAAVEGRGAPAWRR